MKKSLTDILIEALVGKKIKLYKVFDTSYDPKGREYLITDKGDLYHPTKCQIVGETHGTIRSIETGSVPYEGDSYMVDIVDDDGELLHVNGFYSITNKIEIL